MELRETTTESATRADTLTETAAGGASGADEALRTAVDTVARACGPGSIDALVALLRRLNKAAPRRIAAFPVVRDGR